MLFRINNITKNHSCMHKVSFSKWIHLLNINKLQPISHINFCTMLTICFQLTVVQRWLVHPRPDGIFTLPDIVVALSKQDGLAGARLVEILKQQPLRRPNRHICGYHYSICAMNTDTLNEASLEPLFQAPPPPNVTWGVIPWFHSMYGLHAVPWSLTCTTRNNDNTPNQLWP